MHRNHPHRQEDAFELEDTAPALEREQELHLEVVFQSETETANNYEKDRYTALGTAIWTGHL